MKALYLVLFVIGCVLPLSQLVPWVVAHGGLDPRLFLAELFANHVSAFFAWDVIVSAVVVLAWSFEEHRQRRVRHAWMPALATLLVGVSAGLPLLLYMKGQSATSGGSA